MGSWMLFFRSLAMQTTKTCWNTINLKVHWTGSVLFKLIYESGWLFDSVIFPSSRFYAFCIMLMRFYDGWIWDSVLWIGISAEDSRERKRESLRNFIVKFYDEMTRKIWNLVHQKAEPAAKAKFMCSLSEPFVRIVCLCQLHELFVLWACKQKFLSPISFYSPEICSDSRKSHFVAF